MPPFVAVWGLKALGFVQAAWESRWTGWVLFALLLWPLSCSRSALSTAQAELDACREAAAAVKPASVEKGSASANVRVTVHHGVFDAPAGSVQPAPGASTSSWAASPCPDVVVEAGSQSDFTRTETPASVPAPVAPRPKNEIWVDAGYNLGQVAGPTTSVRLEHGRGAAWASASFMKGAPTWGVGAGYCAVVW